MSARALINTTNEYEKFRKKMIKRGRDVSKLDETVEYLATYQRDKLKYNHPLKHNGAEIPIPLGVGMNATNKI